MGRKTWVKPMTFVQKFEANEAIAASPCWYIEECEWTGIGHLSAGCRNAKSYRYDYNDTGEINYVELTPTGGWPYYECVFYRDNDHTERIETEDIKPGDTLYWRTLSTNHCAVAKVKDPSVSNHS